MENFALFHHVLLIAIFIIPSISRPNVILQPNAEVCLGALVTFTCTVNGTHVAWRYDEADGGGDTDSYFGARGSTANLRPLGRAPFSTRVTDVSGGIITSIATSSNLTRRANGVTLECSNGLFLPGSEIVSVTLPLQDLSAVLFVCKELIGSSLSELIIHICWPKSTCAPSYQVKVMRDGQPVLHNITEDTCYEYNVPDNDIGTYTMYVRSIDYFGVISDQPTNTTIHIRRPNITVGYRFNCHSNSILIIIEDSFDDQLPITLCNVRLMSDDGSYNENKDCTKGNMFEFNNAMCGRNYTYNAIISNVVNSSTESGLINLAYPSVTTTTYLVYPSVTTTTSYCSSTTMSSSQCPTPTPCPPCPSSSPQQESELPLWALIIVFGVLFVSALTFIILQLWRRLRCCNLECWDSVLCTYLLCDCLKNCCRKDEKIKARCLRTKSLDEKQETASHL
ncbi:PREDICTED: uncharacterized protein LOC109585446 isoform X2 [Amphimedon queenslandica]|uniref:Ig-like domain-containing protein n=1 Tax=Amphimedon queenslandica TaxID=400682 RepID=A0AAN0JJ82_AMPQE|nr:PREDICTED: uncharacterized protein LOC109585446 isoform X2 [Amphimedon queenslandica]|eukprot:XP_019857090.1 PREDICTED: uncharacterized protein LOC109585446 isoform X2 [Amphimedon queenslandica]